MNAQVTEWVALETFEDSKGKFREAGAVYADEPRCSARSAARKVTAGEHEAVCARCGQRSVGVDQGTAEELRELHFYGDEEIPSICAPTAA